MSRDVYHVIIQGVNESDVNSIRERMKSCDGFIVCADQPDSTDDLNALCVRMFCKTHSRLEYHATDQKHVLELFVRTSLGRECYVETEEEVERNVRTELARRQREDDAERRAARVYSVMDLVKGLMVSAGVIGFICAGLGISHSVIGRDGTGLIAVAWCTMILIWIGFKLDSMK